MPEVSIKIITQAVGKMSEGSMDKSELVILEGTIAQEKQEKLKNFQNKMKTEIMKDLDQQSWAMEIECKIGAGVPYVEIKDVFNIKTQ